MTAKEKLLREVLDLDEAEAAAARIVIERRPTEKDDELEAILDEEADESDRRRWMRFAERCDWRQPARQRSARPFDRVG